MSDPSGGILVDGATTPLGLALLHRLAAEGRGPLLAVAAEDPEEAEAVLPRGVRYLQVDLTRPRRVRRLLFGPVRTLGIETVVHLAAHRDPDTTGERAHRLNVGAARLMLRLSEDHPTIRRFVHRSDACVYRNRTDQADVLREDSPLNLSPRAPQWVRDRVEADVTVCARMGLSDLRIVVLRCAEVLAPDMGSQLWDYLSARVCVRPMGYDPMIEVLSKDDAVTALALALEADSRGVFNVRGTDVLPLSRAIRAWGRDDLPIPGPLVGPLYAARHALGGRAFRYDLNRWRFHFSAVLDGTRAEQVLGYAPRHPIVWPGLAPPAPL